VNIICEGIDKSGKSTIANDIRESLYPVVPVTFKLSQKPNEKEFFTREMVIKIYLEMFAQAHIPMNEKHIFLFDRSYPSEMAYSFLRGYDAMENEKLWDLDNYLGVQGKTLLIYCEVDPEVSAKRFKELKEEYAREKDILTLRDRYETFLKRTRLPYIRINSLTDRGANLAVVRKFIREHESFGSTH
jgi:thymidylate kinase